MQVKRTELIDVLRAQEPEKTVHRAEQTLPPDVDLDRDSGLLRQLGIDPDLLATLLSPADDPAQPTDVLSQPTSNEDQVVNDRLSAEDSSGVGPSMGSHVRHDSSTDLPATTHPRTQREAVTAVVHLSPSLCPRCGLNFGSIDLMLDHLNSDHLTSNSSAGARGSAGRARLSLSTREIDEALKDIARRFDEPVPQMPKRQRQRRPSLMTVIGALLLITGIVSVVAGQILAGAALIVLTMLVATLVRTVRRLRPVATRTRTTQRRAECD